MTTNYEKIKNMNIDEMARMIKDEMMCQCRFCIYSKDCLGTDYQRTRCFDGIKQWLEQECE